MTTEEMEISEQVAAYEARIAEECRESMEQEAEQADMAATSPFCCACGRFSDVGLSGYCGDCEAGLEPRCSTCNDAGEIPCGFGGNNEYMRDCPDCSEVCR